MEEREEFGEVGGHETEVLDGGKECLVETQECPVETQECPVEPFADEGRCS